jgi:hypothetical protein
MTAAGGPTGLGRGVQLLELLERLLDLPLVLGPPVAEGAAQAVDDEPVPALLTDPGDLQRHLTVVGRFDLQPRPWVLALGRGVPAVVLAVMPPPVDYRWTVRPCQQVYQATSCRR